MHWSKANKTIIHLHEKGYWMDDRGRMFNPSGKEVKGYIKGTEIGDRYRVMRVPAPFTAIKFHRFQAYQKFGNDIFDFFIVVIHLDGDSLNNDVRNIGLGSRSDNQQDISPKVRKAYGIKLLIS